jgi:serine/threonine protein kinase
MQLKMNDTDEIIFEWIPYNQFNNIKKIDEGGFSTIYLARWKNGPLLDYYFNEYKRDQNKKVVLKCLHESHDGDSMIKFLNEV